MTYPDGEPMTCNLEDIIEILIAGHTVLHVAEGYGFARREDRGDLAGTLWDLAEWLQRGSRPQRDGFRRKVTGWKTRPKR